MLLFVFVEVQGRIKLSLFLIVLCYHARIHLTIILLIILYCNYLFVHLSSWQGQGLCTPHTLVPFTKQQFNICGFCFSWNLHVITVDVKTIRLEVRELTLSWLSIFMVHFSSVQSLSHVRLFATPWIAARQASLSITNFPSLLKPMFIESVMTSSHLMLCRPLLLLPPIPPSIRVFSNESALHMRWPKYWSFSFSISPSNEHPGWLHNHNVSVSLSA